MKRSSLLLLVAIAFAASPATAQEWNIQVVDDGGNTGYSSRVTATSDGIPYILYQTNTNEVTLAWYVTGGGPGGWDRIGWSEIDGYHQVMGLDVDGDDNLHIAYSKMTSPYRLRYGVFDHATKSWDLSPEDASTGYGDLSLALWDSAGTIIPCIAFSMRATPYEVRFTRRDPVSGNWHEEVVWDDYETDRPSLAVDTSGVMHISFYDQTGNNLMYATNAGGVWVTEYVDYVDLVGSYSAIVIDSDNTPYIVYYDATNKDLKYAKLLN